MTHHRTTRLAGGAEPCPETYIGWTVELVGRFLLNNSLPAPDLPALISSTYACLTKLRLAGSHVPAVDVSASVHDEYLVCLEDGRKLKTLRRHLQRAFNMTPEDYRRKWGLPDDYPMVAPAYSRARSDIARGPGPSED